MTDRDLKPAIDRRRPIESGHGRIRTLTRPGAGLVEIRDGQGGTVCIGRGDLAGLIGILERDLRFLSREAER